MGHGPVLRHRSPAVGKIPSCSFSQVLADGVGCSHRLTQQQIHLEICSYQFFTPVYCPLFLGRVSIQNPTVVIIADYSSQASEVGVINEPWDFHQE